MTIGAGVTALQTDVGPKFVVDCSVKPVAVTGQLKTTIALE